MATKYSNINTSAVSFSELKTIPMAGSNRKTVYVNYDNGRFVIETPVLTFPFGMYEDQMGDKTKYSLTINFDETDAGKEFKKLMNDISTLVKSECQKNSKTWLGKNYKTSEIEVLYNDHVKKYRDRETGEENGKYPDTFKVKLPFYDGKFSCDVYDNKKNKLSDEDIKTKFTKGTTGKLAIQCTGVYFVSGKFGVSWRVVQAKITPKKDMSAYAFLSSDEEDD